jgi:hypothetical protein
MGVHRKGGCIEGLNKYDGGGLVADAGQGFEGFEFPWNNASVLLKKHVGELMNILCFGGGEPAGADVMQDPLDAEIRHICGVVGLGKEGWRNQVNARIGALGGEEDGHEQGEGVRVIQGHRWLWIELVEEGLNAFCALFSSHGLASPRAAMYPFGGGVVQLDLAHCRDVLLAEPIEAPDGGWPEGAPTADYRRSPAAARVGRFAAQSGLRLFHYEQREQFDLPMDWLPAGLSDEDALAPEWDRGILAERKYQSFRHDQIIGGFNPGHRGKWSTHELCHGLVGFGYRPDPSPLFIATAGRLAELVPVVLWYFLDEIGLQRCPVHQGGGPLFRAYCADCEEVAGSTVPCSIGAEKRLGEAASFMDRELAAIARSRISGRPVPHQWATINLCSDGLAYAHAHGGRLRSKAFQEYAERFLFPGGGSSETLDQLEDRVREVFLAIAGEQETLSPWAPSRAHGRLRWQAQDLGWRLTMAAQGQEGAVKNALEQLLERLSRLCRSTADREQAFSELEESWGVALEELGQLDELLGAGSAASVAAVGYPMGPFGRSIPLVLEGLCSATPLTMQLLEDAENTELVRDFVVAEQARREPLVSRWVAYLSAAGPPLLAALARYERALLEVSPSTDVGLLGLWGGGKARLGKSYQLLALGWNSVEIAARVDSGAYFGLEDAQGLRVVDEYGKEPEPDPTVLLLGYEPGGELIVADIDEGLADTLRSGVVEGLPEETLAWLTEIGAIEPEEWPL